MLPAALETKMHGMGGFLPMLPRKHGDADHTPPMTRDAMMSLQAMGAIKILMIGLNPSL